MEHDDKRLLRHKYKLNLTYNKNIMCLSRKVQYKFRPHLYSSCF